MLSLEKCAPAAVWRAFFVSALLLVPAAFGAAPPRPPPELAQVGKPSAEEAARLVEQVRTAGIPGEFYLEFQLRSLPRRGKGKTFQGQLWSGRDENGVISRVEIVDAGGVTRRFLFERGASSRVWRWENGRAVALMGSELFAPLIEGVEVSAFDLQMPFLYWPDVTVERLARVLGRPAWAMLFAPPPDFSASEAHVAAVRAYLDTQFNAIMQTELIGPKQRPTKTFSFRSLKRVGDQYLPKQADFRNEATRDKTRLEVTAAALDLRLPPEIFDPAALETAVPPPSKERIVRFEQ